MTDYLAHNLWLLWTLVCVLALILEVSSGTFYIMCFAIGAAVTILIALVGLPLWIQVLTFALATLASVYAVRPFLLKFMHPKGPSRKSNADALLGRTGVVIEPIVDGHSGYVKIDGDEWKAVSSDGRNFDKGQRVKVVGRESIIVTVDNI
ncbi:MAG: NfeD family protein [Prevotella sp.]